MRIDTKQKYIGFESLAMHSDLLIALVAVVVVGMIILPIPQWLMDVFLSVNITLALTILLVTIYTVQPLQFSSFPSLLLLTTVFRLALNIAATRLILLNADAGRVIEAFGTVVVGGNYVVGIVVFAILVIIQFLVITNGAGRVAEVAARFTLDAMPGKQMAIDADLNAGIIDESEAQQRRKNIQREADFYGAMDGASKFVRGDAIAAVIMIIVNILGGFVVGIVQKHMNAIEAMQTYALLTVGMGLVTQIPALLVSTATGLMVTKSASENNLGWDIAGQMLAQPKALGVSAIIFASIAIIPGLPKLPFLLVAAGSGSLAYLISQARKTPVPVEPAETVTKPPEPSVELLSVDPIELEIGYGLIPLADPKQGGDLLERITMIRRQIAADLGFLVPAVRVRDNVQLGSNKYAIKLRGVEVVRGEIYPGQLMAMDAGAASDKLQGVETREPAFGLTAFWISEQQRPEAESKGYAVVDAVTVLITHLSEIIKLHAPEILSRQDAQAIIDNTRQTAQAVVEELIPNVLTVGEVQKILQNLLAERVSIRDMVSILETLADYAQVTRDTDLLTGFVRERLARQISLQYASDGEPLKVFTVHPAVEQLIAESVRQTERGNRPILDPNVYQELLVSIRTQMENMLEAGLQPIALVSPRIRIHFRRLVEHAFPTLAVLSHNEIIPELEIETVGLVTIEMATESSIAMTAN